VRLLSRWLTACVPSARHHPVFAVAVGFLLAGVVALEPAVLAFAPPHARGEAVEAAVPAGVLPTDLIELVRPDGRGSHVRIVLVPGSALTPGTVLGGAALASGDTTHDTVVIGGWGGRLLVLGGSVPWASSASVPSALFEEAGTIIPMRVAIAVSAAAAKPVVVHVVRHRTPRRPAPPRRATRPAAPRVTSGWNIAPIVTWYGPGFYNNRTACGQRYTRTIIGVAHRTLPCGTLIQFRWHGMTAVAPVIDRGPYAGPAFVFDFSAALACHVFRPKGVKNSCYTRHNVQWRIVRRAH